MLYKNKQNKNKNKKMLDNQVNTWYNIAKSRERQTDNKRDCKQADSIKTNLTYVKTKTTCNVASKAHDKKYYINKRTDEVILPEKVKTTQK